MNLKDVKKMAKEICEKYGYPYMKSIKLNYRMKTTLGKCNTDGEIELNKYVVEHNDEDVVRALLAHEIIHLKHFNHKKEFREEAKRMGTSHYIENIFPDIMFPRKKMR